MSLFNSLYIIFQNMNEASSLLSATCNTFITTLEECVKIANAKFKPEMFQLSHPDPLVSPVSPSPVQMVGTSYCSSSNIACGFVFVFISKGRIWQWKGNSQQVEFFFFFFFNCTHIQYWSLSSGGLSRCQGPDPLPLAGCAIYPSVPGKCYNPLWVL